MHQLLDLLALPQLGLSTVFIVALVSATLLPLGSEAAVVGLLQLRPDLFWPCILVATAGNTIGGAISWWMGLAAHKGITKARAHSHAKTVAEKSQTSALSGAATNDTHSDDGTTEEPGASYPSNLNRRATAWLRRYGAKACLLSWLPIVGDPLCAVAGWLKLPFWPCVFYMAIGKFLRYLIMTTAAIHAIPFFTG